MEALIALIAFTVIAIAGIVGLINPSKVKLKNRWQAVTVLSAFIPTIGILMVLFPGTPQPPQTPAEMRNAGAGLIAIWFVIVGSIFALRYMIARSQSLESARLSFVAPERQTSTSKFDPTASPKIGIMRSVASAMDSSLKERIVAEIKLMPNVATFDESAIAHTHHVTPALVKTLADKARLEMLGVYFDEALTAQTLDKANAVKFARTLGLSDSNFDKIWGKFQKIEASIFLDGIMKDGQITPEETTDLKRIQKMLQIDFGSRSSEIYEAQKMWLVCNAPLEGVNAPLMMKRGEVCFGFSEVTAFEIRTRTKAISYGGPSLRVPIAKGLSFRIGHSRIAQHKEEHQHSFGFGQLCVTDKRLLWSGPNRTFSIPYDKVIDLDPYADGITIFKDTGKPLSFDYGGQNKVLSALISRVVDEHR